MLKNSSFVKINLMKNYELTLVLKTDLEKTILEKLLAKIKKMVTENGGKVTKEEEWGKRVLSYPLKKQTEGLYYCLDLDLEKKEAPEISHKLQMEENVLRHLIVIDDR